MKRRIFFSLMLILAVSLGFGCRSKTVVKKLANQNGGNGSSGRVSKAETDRIDGVMYHLPKTIVQATVTVNKSSKVPGDFVDFAPCFFSASEREGMVTVKSDAYSIAAPTFSSRGVPDTSETYVLKTKGKYFESKTVLMEYAPGYVLQKGEAESKNETLEFTVKALATVASVAAKVAPLGFRSDDPDKNADLSEALRKEHQCYQIVRNDLAGAAASQQSVENEIRELVSQPAQPVGDAADQPAPVGGNVRNPNPAPRRRQQRQRRQQQQQAGVNITRYIQQDDNREKYQKALAVFNELKLLEEQRGKITGSNIPAETYKLMLEKNAEAIAAFRAAFLGRKTKEAWTTIFEFSPETNREDSPLLFTYSKEKGICRTGLVKEKSLPIGNGFEYAACGATPDNSIQALWLRVIKNADSRNYLNKIYAAATQDERKDKSRGWFYRVPADSVVTLRSAEIPCKPLNGVRNYTCAPLSIKFRNGNIEIEQTSNVFLPIRDTSEQLALGEMQVAQLGVVASVPASTAGRSSTTTIVLDPATGAMKNYKSSSTALIDKAVLDDAQKAANSAIDAADPLNKKKRELEEKKIQNQINDEDKKLNENKKDNDN